MNHVDLWLTDVFSRPFKTVFGNCSFCFCRDSKMEQNSQELRGTQPTQPVSDENYEDNGSVVYGRLAPLHGKDLEEILLTPEHEKYLVGKDPACNVVLPDLNGISHRHFEGDSSDSPNQTRTIFIEDKSTCGTYVRGKRIGKANKTVLSNGDEITLGGTTPDGSGNKKFLSYIFLQRSAKDDSTEVNDTYDIRDFIGSGNFSIVKQAIHRSTGDQYACKIINMHKWASQPAVLRALEREQHIVSFIDFYRDPKTYWIIMEFVSGGDLNGYLGKKPVLEESEVKHLTRQICEAVQITPYAQNTNVPFIRPLSRNLTIPSTPHHHLTYMHEKGFVHRDIKPDNILLTLPDRNFVKLSDLGGFEVKVYVSHMSF
ncbi:hypothetical protein BC936DRAFT_148369 [Jimgerdemannia flammicorona]|uniref:non-specific serine/threonine protein kinase n=1 Tax=Jimgerdemannia flammicorona TaxID=994334 RepID=A0A433D380_9FUNG|nr:hypothetical protein BC936DRAFT_148369 [Jimgerdemannia flammicorona]